MNTITAKTIAIIAGVGIVLVVGFMLRGADVQLPSGETSTERIVIEDGQVIGTTEEVRIGGDIETDSDHGEPSIAVGEPNPNVPSSEELVETEKVMDKIDSDLTTNTDLIVKEIFVTDGVRHSVALDEILGGGPPKDGIPPIDDPEYISVSDARSFLSDDEPGLAIDIRGVRRFYPYQILVWHEIVNDIVNGQRILVTYCPLCLSGVVFDPVVNGERVEFGTSGKLWNSNLVMYDRKTDSLWSQVLGEAIVGEMTGTRLEYLPSDITTFGAWAKVNPDGAVLSRDTGFNRSYGFDPYGNYYTSDGTRFPVTNSDDRLHSKAFVLGVLFGDKAKAYAVDTLKTRGVVEDKFAGRDLVFEYDAALDSVRVFEKQEGEARVRVNPLPNFWFSWVAAYPDTELFK